MDNGIAGDPRVIFASGFEDGFSGWTKHRQSGIHDIVRDQRIAHSGGACLQSTANRGKDSGGDCVYKLPKTVEKIHIRFYCRFHRDTCIPHHFVKIRANPTNWWGGGAGYRPRGDKAFWTGIEPTRNHTWLFYTYWHKMRSWNNPDGRPNNPPRGTGRSFYGNTFHPDKQTPFKMDEWICVEAMMKCNTVGRSDGEQAFWIDGKKIGRWRPGEPVGTWIRDKFVTSGPYNRRPAPFEGFDFRTSPDVEFSAVALQWYVSQRVAKDAKTDRNIVYFDDVVVATEYIGPMATVRNERKTAPDRAPAKRQGVAGAEALARKGDLGGARAAYGEIVSSLGEEDARVRAEIELRIAGLAERDGLMHIVTRGFEAKGAATATLTVAGRSRRARILRADSKHVALDVEGVETFLPWERLGARELGSLASAYAASSGDYLAIAKYLLACGEREAAAAALSNVRASGLPEPDREALALLEAAVR